MQPSKEQVIHDLAMACVNGVVQHKALLESKDDLSVPLDAGDFAIDVIMAYKTAWDMIFPQIDIQDED